VKAQELLVFVISHASEHMERRKLQASGVGNDKHARHTPMQRTDQALNVSKFANVKSEKCLVSTTVALELHALIVHTLQVNKLVLLKEHRSVSAVCRVQREKASCYNRK
jgi:hypothetical protein